MLFWFCFPEQEESALSAKPKYVASSTSTGNFLLPPCASGPMDGFSRVVNACVFETCAGRGMGKQVNEELFVYGGWFEREKGQHRVRRLFC